MGSETPTKNEHPSPTNSDYIHRIRNLLNARPLSRSATAVTLPAQEQKLVINLRDREQWLELTSDGSARNTLFCTTENPLATGARVRLEINVARGPWFGLSGVVISRRHVGGGRLKAGVGVYVSEGCASIFAFLNAWARRQIEDRRESQRLPARLLVSYRSRGQRRVNFTRDISRGGMFIHASQILEEGRSAELQLTAPDGDEILELRGVVTHHGEDRGMGIKLAFASSDERDCYDRFLGQVERQVHAGALSPESLQGSAG